MRVKLIALSCVLLAVGCKRSPAPSQLSSAEAAEVIGKSKAFTTSIAGPDQRVSLNRDGLLALGAKGYLECTSVGRKEENVGALTPTPAGIVFIRDWPRVGVSDSNCSPPGKRFDVSGGVIKPFSLPSCRRKLIAVTSVSTEPGVERTVGFTWRWDTSSIPSDARTIMFGPSGEPPQRQAAVTFSLQDDGWHAQFGHEWEQ